MEPVPALAVHSVDPTLMFVYRKELIFRSGDGGCHWSQVDIGEYTEVSDSPQLWVGNTVHSVLMPGSIDPLRVYVVLRGPVDPTGLVLHGAGQTFTLLVSDDGGKSWAEPMEIPPAWLYRASSGDEDVIYGATRDAAFLYRSTDGGLSWEQRPGPVLPWGAYPQTPYQGTRQGTRLQGEEVRDFYVSPKDPNELWLWNGYRISHSIDGAVTWDPLALPIEPESDVGGGPFRFDVLASEKSTSIAAACLCGVKNTEVFASDDGARSWEHLPPYPREEWADWIWQSTAGYIYAGPMFPAILRFAPKAGRWRVVDRWEGSQSWESPAISGSRRPSFFFVTSKLIERFSGTI